MPAFSADTTRIVLDLDKIRLLRDARGLSQSEAAQAAGFKGRAQWNQVETGRSRDVRLSTLYAIARALQVHPRELLADPSDLPEE